MASVRQLAPGKGSTAWICGLGVAALGGVLIQAPAAHALNPPVSTPGSPDPTAAISSFTNELRNSSLSNTTYGYQFTTSSAIAIKNLGIFDFGSDGLTDSHAVGIWDLSQNLLATVTVPSGTSSTLVNGFRYANLASPVVLGAGTYKIGAYYANGSTDSFVQYFIGQNSSVTTGNFISLGGSFDSAPPFAGLDYPNNPTSASPGYFGPNFQYEAVPAPLPVFGAATAFGFSRRLRKRIRSHRSLG